MLLKKIISLKNIGRFQNLAATTDVDFRRLTLVYGANGHGKTTLVGVLRSLATGDRAYVDERATLGAVASPSAEILLDNNAVAKFSSGTWSTTASNLELFDTSRSRSQKLAFYMARWRRRAHCEHSFDCRDVHRPRRQSTRIPAQGRSLHRARMAAGQAPRLAPRSHARVASRAVLRRPRRAAASQGASPIARLKRTNASGPKLRSASYDALQCPLLTSAGIRRPRLLRRQTARQALEQL